MPKLINLEGKMIGRLQILKNTEKRNKRIYWECICTCGNVLFIDGTKIRNGETKSCGCLRIETTKKRVTTHGHTHTKTYTTWINMRNRCNNPKNTGWKTYGGAGITVCERWENSFMNFLQDMGESDGKLQLDRINTSLGYSKENCRWVTSKINNNNRTNNRIVEYKGRKLTISELSQETGINYFKLYKRIIRRKWPIEKATTTP
jgi:hypothetical protein